MYYAISFDSLWSEHFRIFLFRRAAIVLAFINYQLHYETLSSKDISIGMVPQLMQSAYDFQLGVSEVVNVSSLLSYGT